MSEPTSAKAKRSADLLVSVIVPCYRQAKYLPRAIESLLEQKHRNWECIIVNDGSPDDTREVAAQLTRQDPRIRYVEQDNRGPGSARNRGLAEVRGDFVQFLDADDLLLPDKFSTVLAAASDASKPCVMVSDYWLMDESGRQFENYMCTPEFRFSTLLQDMALRWETELSFPPNALLFDARFFRRHGVRFDETLPNHEDWDCWMRIFVLHPVVRRVRQRLSVYRVHRESLTRSDERAKLARVSASNRCANQALYRQCYTASHARVQTKAHGRFLRQDLARASSRQAPQEPLVRKSRPPSNPAGPVSAAGLA